MAFRVLPDGTIETDSAEEAVRLGIQMVHRGMKVPGPKEHDYGIVAVCRTGRAHELTEVVPIAPVECRGAAGLWRLPDELLVTVRARWLAAKAALL